MPEEVGEELDRARVGPVEVVEDQDNRLGFTEDREERPHRPVGPEALLSEYRRAPGRQWLEYRQGDGQLGSSMPGQVFQALGREPGQVVVDGIDKDAEGKLALVLGGTPAEHETVTLLGADLQLLEQACLSD